MHELTGGDVLPAQLSFLELHRHSEAYRERLGRAGQAFIGWLFRNRKRVTLAALAHDPALAMQSDASRVHRFLLRCTCDLLDPEARHSGCAEYVSRTERPAHKGVGRALELEDASRATIATAAASRCADRYLRELLGRCTVGSSSGSVLLLSRCALPNGSHRPP